MWSTPALSPSREKKRGRFPFICGEKSGRLSRTVTFGEGSSLAEEILSGFFSDSFPRLAWEEEIKHILEPRGAPALRRSTTDQTAVILTRFQKEVNLNDYFALSPAQPSSPEEPSTMERSFYRFERDVQCEEELAFGAMFCGQTISTYPHPPSRSRRMGDPICDHWVTEIHSNK